MIFICLILVLSSCKENKTRIGILLYSREDNALNIVLDQIIEELKDYEIIIFDAEKSQMLQNDQFLSLIDKGCRVILVNLVDRLSASAYVDKAKRVNIPIVFFNREPIWEDLYNYNKAYYVGNSGDAIGQMQANIIGRMYKNPNSLAAFYDINGNNIIEMVILKGEQGHQTTETIFSKCMEVLRDKNYSTNILATEYGDWDRLKAKEAIKKLYYSKNCQDSRGKCAIELVVCNNDEMAMGVIDFIFEEEIYYINREDGSYIMPFDIIGANITTDSMEAIKKNYIYGSITGEEKRQGEVIGYLTRKLANNEEIDLSIYESELYEDGEHIYTINNNFIYVNGNIIYSQRR